MILAPMFHESIAGDFALLPQARGLFSREPGIVSDYS
jgi:hypothetical protein